MRSLRIGALCVFALLLAGTVAVQSASASTIIEANSTVIVNFDFTNVTPSPPYSEIEVDLTLTSLGGGGSSVTTAFTGDLDGEGSLFPFISDSGFLSIIVDNVPLTSLGDGDLLDGIFSFVVTVTEGADVQLDGPIATAFVNEESTGPIAGVVAQVSGPPTLALLGIGALASLALLRRTRSSPSGRSEFDAG
jgi:hypothetical protein